jgi:hypothetical protein
MTCRVNSKSCSAEEAGDAQRLDDDDDDDDDNPLPTLVNDVLEDDAV